MRVANALILVLIFAALEHVPGLARGSDSAIATAMQQAESGIVSTHVWRRAALTPDLDLVIAFGSPSDRPPLFGEDRTTLTGTGWLGLFLQERSRPDRVFRLSVGLAPRCDEARLIRLTSTDTVVGCTAEKFSPLPNHKFVYDVRAKRLVSHFEYQPFRSLSQVTHRSTGTTLAADSGTERVTVEWSPGGGLPRVTSRTRHAHQHDLPVQGQGADRPRPRFGDSGHFRVVEVQREPGDDLCEAIAGEAILDSITSRHYRLRKANEEDCSTVGPVAVEGPRLWFGRSVYSGESFWGSSGFGFFDTAARRFEEFPLPPTAQASVEALHVTPAAVWLALAAHHEYSSYGRGLLRYDRTTRTMARHDTAQAIGLRFMAIDDRLLLLTTLGFVEILDTGVHGYFIDQTSDGRLRIAEGYP